MTKSQRELDSTNKQVSREENVKQEIQKHSQHQKSEPKLETDELKKVSETSSQFSAEIFNHAEEFLRNYHETQLNKKQQPSSLNDTANANGSLGGKRKRERKAAFEASKRVRANKSEERIRCLLD